MDTTTTTETDAVEGVTVSVTVMREDGSVLDITETHDGHEYLTQSQFERLVEVVGTAVLVPDQEPDEPKLDTSRMFGGVA